MTVAIAAASYGFAIVYTRNHLRGLPSLVAPTSQLVLATLYLLPLSLVFNRPWQLPVPSPAALASLLALGVLGTGLAFVVYYRLLEIGRTDLRLHGDLRHSGLWSDSGRTCSG
ncbi:MAG: EamA family transporter [Chloroflexota bacterium]